MTSFDGTTLIELNGGGGYVTWPKAAVSVLKKIPGGSVNVIQKIGTGVSRLSIPALLTAAQASALQGKVGNSGSLVFSYETVTATLEAMEPLVSVGIDNDLYQTTLTFRRSSAPAGSVVSDAILLEDGTYLLLEDGTNLLLE